MRHGSVTLLALLLVSQALALLAVLPAPAAADIGEIVIPADEHWTWENGSKNLSGLRVSVFGTLSVEDYRLHYNVTADGQASLWVMEGGLLEFRNVSLMAEEFSNDLFFKVEGRFVAHASEIDHLTGQFATGGGIKCVGGEVELFDTYIHDCKVQGVYVEGSGGRALLDNVSMDGLQYGVHVKDGGKVTLRNGCVLDQMMRAGVLVNRGEADVSNTTVTTDRSAQTKGIVGRDCELRVTDCDITGSANEAIELADGSIGYVTNCKLSDHTVGVRLSESSADVWGCNIDGCVDGVNLFVSDGIVRQCHLTGNYNGVTSKDCVDGYELRGCTIGGNSQYGVYAVGDGLTESGTAWTDASGEPNGIARVLQWWLLNVTVTDRSAEPIASAEVIVRGANGTRVFNGTTNALGSVREVRVEGWRIENDGTNNSQGEYRVRAEEGERWGEFPVTMDRNRDITIQLGEVPSITEGPVFWAVPVTIVMIVVAVVFYWWRYVR